MALLPIIVAPDPRLNVKCENVDQVTDNVKRLMNDMMETMYDAPGIGLAAVQVGVPLRVIVMDISWNKEDGIKEPKYFVNPVISNKAKDLSTYEEGCLSVPDQYAEIERPEKCVINYLDYDGKEKQEEVEGLFATCIQHEMDHLEGILFIDYLSKLKKSMIIKKLSKNKSTRIVV